MQQQIKRLIEERARYGERKNAVHRAVYRRRLHDEMQRVWGRDDAPQAATHRHLGYLALVGAAGFLDFLLTSLI
jgi:hypothetical protein